MFPFRLSSIFRSRWIALLFAANIVWFATDVVDGRGAAATRPSHAASTSASGGQQQTLDRASIDNLETVGQDADQLLRSVTPDGSDAPPPR